VYLCLQFIGPLIFPASNLLGAKTGGRTVEQEEFLEMMAKSKGWIRSPTQDYRAGVPVGLSG
jgi:hypothetical protein